MNLGSRGGNDVNRKHRRHPQRERRRQRAQQRQAAAALRTPEQQIERLNAAGLAAIDERGKLELRIQARRATGAGVRPPAAAKQPENTKRSKKS